MEKTVLSELEQIERIPGFSDYYYFNESFPDTEYGLGDSELCQIVRKANPSAQALTAVISILGLLLNCGVIFVMVMLKEFKKTVQHWLLLQLFITNVVFLLFVFLEIVNEHHEKWVMGNTMCKLDEATIFTSRSAGILFLALSNILGIVSAIGIKCKCPSSLPSWSKNKVVQMAKYGAVIFFAWFPSAMVNLPIYHFNNVNDCERCVLEFPIDIDDICPLLGLNWSACVDVFRFFTDGMNSTGLDSNVGNFEYSGSDIDTDEFSVLLQDNLTEMAQLMACDYEEPRSFFVWLLASFTLFFAIPIFILIAFIFAWLYSTLIRRRGNETSLLGAIFALDILFILCWTPWNAVHMKKAYGGLGKDGYQCASLLHYARLSALIYNAFAPVIYAALSKDFALRALEAFNSSASFCYDILKMSEKPPLEPTKLERADSGDYQTTVTSVSESTGSLNSGYSPAATPV